MRRVLFVCVVWGLWAGPAVAQESGLLGADRASREVGFGAVLAPAVMPSGAMSFYGLAGAPDLVLGVRQGYGGFELEGRVRADYLQLGAGVEGGVRVLALSQDGLEVAPTLTVGLLGNTGSDYFWRYNFNAWMGRVAPGVVATWPLTETVRLLGLVDAPFDFSVDRRGGWRFQLLGGGGAEVYLGEDMSLLVAAQLGGDFRRAPRDETHSQVGWNVRLGVGKRLF